MIRSLLLAPLLLSIPLHAQLFDAHLHAQTSERNAVAMREALDATGAVHAVLIGTAFDLEKYRQWFPGAIPALLFPCEGGRTPNGGAPCFPNGAEFPDLDWLRGEITAKRIQVLGEITAQYSGIAPDDPRLSPYFALAEELDVPVGVHLGIGPPGAAYAGPGFPPRKSPGYRGRAGNPRLLEEILIRHPKLRLYVMHAAWPFLDDMLYMLYMHPRLHVDISVLQYAIPRPEMNRYLRTLVEAGFGNRIMFGSDGGAKHLKEGIAAISEATYLSAEQKRAILYDNAMTFFRIPKEAAASSRSSPSDGGAER